MVVCFKVAWLVFGVVGEGETRKESEVVVGVECDGGVGVQCGGQ